MLNDANIEENWNEVTLLIPFDTNFIDVKNGNGASEIISAPFISTAAPERKFGGRVIFDGIDDRLRYSHDDDTRIGTVDFTIECWIFPKRFGDTGGGAVGNVRGVLTNNTAYITTTNNRTLLVKLVNDEIFLEIAGIPVGQGSKISSYFWNHIAISRTGTEMKFFVNGDLIHTYTGAGYEFSANNLVLGAANIGSWAHFAGNIDDFRMTKGYGRYTESFDMPSNAYTVGNTIRKAVNFFPMVKLDAKFGTNDSSINPKMLNINRPPSITSNVPFIDGEVSYYFNNSFVATPRNEDFRIGTNDFTIEAWVNTDNLGGLRTICASYGYPTRNRFWFGLTGNVVMVRYGNGNNDSRYLDSDAFFTVNSSYVERVPANKWCHVAWSRQGSTNRIFINGKVAKTFSNRTNWSSSVSTFGASAFQMAVYRQANLSSWWEQRYVEQNMFVGYINDIKYSNLVCKYTNEFDPYLEYPLNRAKDLSLLDVNSVNISHFEERIMNKVEVDTQNNNVFWFNDSSGFVLQKPTSIVPGVWITAATVNASGIASVTLSNGQVETLGDILQNAPVQQGVTVGSGMLTSVNSEDLTFNEFTASNEGVLVTSPTEMLLTSNRVFNRGMSTVQSMIVGLYKEPGVNHVIAGTANIWTKQQLNTVAGRIDGGSLDNGTITLPAGTYYFSGSLISYNGNFSATRLYNITNLSEVLKAHSSSAGSAGVSVQTLLEGHFTLTQQSQLNIEYIAITTATTGLTMPAAAGPVPHIQYTIFKVA